MRIAPSVKNLMESFRFDEATAKQIRWAWKDANKSDLRPIVEKVHKLHHGYIESRSYAAMLAIDIIGEFHGVEYLGKHSRNNADIDYLNSGDSYAPTLVFCGRRMFISTVGDMLENNYVKEH